jgi:ribosomal protein S18 acetylase RimI-like enzyme
MEIREAREPEVDAVRHLFREYAAGLGVDLCFQNFEQELRGLPGDYAPPQGVLLVCAEGAELGGCVGMRRWDDDAAEMKRLYVREALRGQRWGAQLAERALTWARGAGYRRVRLDTLPSMVSAQHLYRRLGFRDVTAYRFNPVEGVRYMELQL